MSVTINGTTGIDTIQDGIVTTAKIATSAVSTAKIAADAVTTPKIADTVNLGRRNLVINGAMQVAQRGSSTGINGGGLYGPDRMRYVRSGRASNRTISQQADGPDNFINCYKIVCDAGSSPSADDINWLEYRIEGQNLYHLNYGSSTAKTTTLSFWVKSNVTGVYTCHLYSLNAVQTRMITQAFTVSSADTWEYITIQFTGDVSSDFPTGNTEGLRIKWILGAGSNRTSVGSDGSWIDYDATKLGPNQTADVFATTNNYWQITGVQLEVGDTATPFEHRSYGEELSLCQRYYFKHKADGSNDPILGTASNWSTTSAYSYIQFPVQMRDTPSGSYSALTDFTYYIAGVTKTPSAMGLSARVTNYAAEWDITSSSLTAGQAGWMRSANSNAYIEYDAEL